MAGGVRLAPHAVRAEVCGVSTGQSEIPRRIPWMMASLFAGALSWQLELRALNGLGSAPAGGAATAPEPSAVTALTSIAMIVRS